MGQLLGFHIWLKTNGITTYKYILRKRQRKLEAERQKDEERIREIYAMFMPMNKAHLVKGKRIEDILIEAE